MDRFPQLLSSRQKCPLQTNRGLLHGFLALLAVAVMTATFAVPSMAATACTVVISTDDSAGAATTPGTLRYAVGLVNGGSCDTITFNLAYPATILLGQGQLEIANTATPIITITGPGAENLAISGNNVTRIFNIDSGVTASISGLTMKDTWVGGSSLAAGAIYNAGTLTVRHSIVSGGEGYSGGGFFNDSGGTLTILNSTVADNHPDYGGGFFNLGTLTVLNSTVSGNVAALGGGITNETGGTLRIRNSTIAGNSAFTGGGILNGGLLAISNSTVFGNYADSDGDGGGVYNAGTFTVKGTIFSQNTHGNCGLHTPLQSEGYNLSDDSYCSFSEIGDANNDASIALDSAGLQENGGPTKTIALLSGSDAIDAIPTSDCTDLESPTPQPVTADQRGVSRPQGTACDIGAYERGAYSFTDNFTAELKILLDSGGNPTGFNLKSDFSSNDLFPLTGNVVLNVGSYSVMVPASQFKLLTHGSKAGSYVYAGTINGVSLGIQINQTSTTGYEFKAAVSGFTLALPTAESPTIPIWLHVGQDGGTTSATPSY